MSDKKRPLFFSVYGPENQVHGFELSPLFFRWWKFLAGVVYNGFMSTNKKVSRRRFLKNGAALGAGALTTSALGCKNSEKKEQVPDVGGARAPLADPKPKAPSAVPPGNGPNIVYIYSDQHRGDVSSPAGHPVVQTPQLQKMASQGVTFGRCYTNAPLCRPGRASMMSGLYPREHGVWTNFKAFDQHGESHVRDLRDAAGYHTMVIGKTHLHLGEGHLDDYKCLLENIGFSDSIELTGPGQSALLESVYTDWLTASTPSGEVDKYKRFKRYMRNYAYRVKPRSWDLPSPDSPAWRLGKEDHIDLYTGRLASEWIADYKEARPFYLQVNLPGPHDPFDATKEYLDRYDVDDPRMPAGITQAPEEPMSHLINQSRKFQNIVGITPEERRRLQRTYYAKVSLIDEAIGQVMNALEKRGLLENTWVIYGSDHGEMLGDHQLINKTVFYESSVHIPCFIRPPGGTKGWKTEALTDQLDVTATILDIGGLGPGKGHGNSLLQKIKGGPSAAGAQNGKDWVVAENHGHGMIRNDRFKLVVNYRRQQPVELFDLKEDSEELTNLINDSAHASTIAKLLDTYLGAAPLRPIGGQLNSPAGKLHSG
jgi:arylsulfatase A-like enzyme